MTSLRGPVVLRARGAAPPDEVWDRYARPARWPTWAPHLRDVHVDGEHLRPGLSGTVVGPGPLRADVVVGHVDTDARTWDWDVAAGPLRLHLEHGVQPGGPGGGSRVWLRMSGPLPVLLAYAPVAALALRRLVAP